MNGQSLISVAAVILWVALIALLFMRLRRRRGSIGTAAVGSLYDMLNEDKRNAVEIIIEERAEARDPEDKDGNLPELEKPKR